MIKIKDMGKEPKWLVIYNTLTKMLGAILIIIALFIITVNVSIVVKNNKSQNKLPDFFGYKQVVIAGKSMLPSLDVGDVILTKPANEINQQDIVVFRDKNNAVVTHRVIEIKEQGVIITQGDNNNSPDEPITEDQIEGIVIFHLKGWGKAIEFLKSSVGLILIIGIPVLYVSITRYMSIQFYKKQMARKQERIEYTNAHIRKKE